MARLAPDPHLAIDRLARLRADLTRLRAEAEAAEAAVLALPDGDHVGFTHLVRIETGPSGDRRVIVLDARPSAETPDVDLPCQPNTTAELPAQTW